MKNVILGFALIEKCVVSQVNVPLHLLPTEVQDVSLWNANMELSVSLTHVPIEFVTIRETVWSHCRTQSYKAVRGTLASSLINVTQGNALMECAARLLNATVSVSLQTTYARELTAQRIITAKPNHALVTLAPPELTVPQVSQHLSVVVKVSVASLPQNASGV